MNIRNKQGKYSKTRSLVQQASQGKAAKEGHVLCVAPMRQGGGLRCRQTGNGQALGTQEPDKEAATAAFSQVLSSGWAKRIEGRSEKGSLDWMRLGFLPS
jgi:hypothetical protein